VPALVVALQATLNWAAVAAVAETQQVEAVAVAVEVSTAVTLSLIKAMTSSGTFIPPQSP
jgi:hypothetical protein